MSKNDLAEEQPLTPDERELLKHYRASNLNGKFAISQYAASAASISDKLAWDSEIDLYGPPAPASFQLGCENYDIDSCAPSDLRFPFEQYFSTRFEDMPWGQQHAFPERVYGLFCRDIFACGGDMRKVSFFAAKYLADRIYKVLEFTKSSEALELYWENKKRTISKHGLRGLTIYAEIYTELERNPSANITTLIAKYADEFCVSYETARADYYRYSKVFSEGKPFPPNFFRFLKPGEDFWNIEY